jgi:hypothetical protein
MFLSLKVLRVRLAERLSVCHDWSLLTASSFVCASRNC